MKNFDNFDESVKHKMDGMNFQFNNANWEKMSQMIDASRPAKKPFGKLPLISSIVVGSALIIGSAWYMITNSSDTKEIAQNTQAVVVEANSNTNDAVVNSNEANKGSVNTKLNNSNERNTSTNNNSNNPISSSNNDANVSKAEQSDLTLKNEVSHVSINTKKVQNEKPLANSNDRSLTQKTISNNDDNKEGNTFNGNVPVGATEGAKLKVDVKPVNNTDKSDNNASVNPELDNVATQQANQQAAQEKNINADQEESDLVALPSVTTNLGQTAETIAAANLKTSVLEEKKAWEYVRVKHHTFSVEGGAINSFGWAVNKTRNGNNISPVLGINYMYNFNSRSSLMIGLQYNSIANLGEAKANFSVTTYGFGANNDVTTYKLNDLHYAVMPIKYIHRINKNNALGFGANMMYLMNTRTQITKTTILESNVSTSETHFEMGYGFDQLNSFNTQLAVSYHHSINNKLAINAELNKALFNVVKDYKYYGAKNTSSAPAAIKLSLTYTLFNK